jgi:hypothetical protein
MFDFTVEVRDKTLARVGQILPVDLNLTITETFNNVGSWTLVLANNHPMVPALRTPGAGIIVTRVDNGTVLISGPVVSPTVDVSSANPGGMVTITGVTDSVILADRLAYPQPANADPTTQTQTNDTHTADAESLMHYYVSGNIGPGASANNALTGDTATLDNPASNGNWVGVANASHAYAASPVHSGAGSMAVTATAAASVIVGSCSNASITTQGAPCKPGDNIYAEAWVRAATTGRTVQVAAEFYNAAGTSIGALFGPFMADVTASWSLVSGNITAPANAAYCRMYVQVTAAALGEVHYIDDPVLKVGFGRRDTRIALATNLGRGATVTKSPRFQTLGSLLAEIGSVANYPTGTMQLGFRVIQVGSALQFGAYQTANRAADVRFDIDNGTLASSKVATAAPNVTRAIVAGQGQGTLRAFDEVTSTTSLAAESAWGRRIEQFIDQRQTSDPLQLLAAGNDALANGGLSQFAMQVTPGDDTAWVFGIDYNLGDIVTVVVRDGGSNTLAATELSTMVTGWVLKADASGRRFGALLGQPSDSQLTDFGARLSNLERNAEAANGAVTMLANNAFAETALGTAYPVGVSVMTLGSGSGWSLASGFATVVTFCVNGSRTYQEYYANNTNQRWSRFYYDSGPPNGWGPWSPMFNDSADITTTHNITAANLTATGNVVVAGDITIGTTGQGRGIVSYQRIVTNFSSTASNTEQAVWTSANIAFPTGRAYRIVFRGQVKSTAVQTPAATIRESGVSGTSLVVGPRIQMTSTQDFLLTFEDVVVNTTGSTKTVPLALCLTPNAATATAVILDGQPVPSSTFLMVEDVGPASAFTGSVSLT